MVTCKKCGCTVTCRAIDPQAEHSEPEKAEPPPAHPVIVSCSCCWTAFRYGPSEVFKGQPSPNDTCTVVRGWKGKNNHNNHNNKEEGKTKGAILIAASLIAAVRLNKEEIKPSPVVCSKIADSIRLAEMIQAKLQRELGHWSLYWNYIKVVHIFMS